MSWLWATVGGVFYAAAWFSMEQFVEWFLADSSSRSAYATISAWWLALYISYIFNLGWRSGLIAGVIFFPLSLLFAHPKNVLREMTFSMDMLVTNAVLCLILALAFLTPMIVSIIVRFGKGKILEKFSFSA